MGVHPNTKIKFYDFEDKKTVHSSGTANVAFNLMTRIANSFSLMGGSFIFYNKYSEILYEGEHIKIYGVAEYNRFSDTWEFAKPIALMKAGAG
jgi:hypothetical protein